MIARVLRFVRLPLLLLLIFAVARFALGAKGVPYAPRGNAMFSIVGLTFVSCFYFGALSRRVGGFGWGGTALVGYSIGPVGASPDLHGHLAQLRRRHRGLVLPTLGRAERARGHDRADGDGAADAARRAALRAVLRDRAGADRAPGRVARAGARGRSAVAPGLRVRAAAREPGAGGTRQAALE